MIGPHVNRVHAPGTRPSITRHIATAKAEAAEEGLDMRAASIFVGGPRNRVMSVKGAEADELRAYAAREGLAVVAHGAYPDNEVWSGSVEAGAFIREERDVCQRAGIGALVVHLPSAPPETVLRHLPALYTMASPDVRIALEVPAVRPARSHYETPEKLAALFRVLRAGYDPRLERVALCLDTAHLWTCGVDLSTYDKAQEWLDRLEAVAGDIPPESIMIHLNDSARPLGTGPDTHAALGAGYIWGDFKADLRASGLAAFVDYAVRHDTVVILERRPKELLADDYRVLHGLTAAARPQ